MSDMKTTTAIEVVNYNYNFLDNKIRHVEGGFGDNQPCILLQDIAVIHETSVKRLNELISKHRDEFNENQMINLMLDPQYKDFIKENKLKTANNQHGVYLFSESGYIKLVSMLRNTAKKQEVMDKFIETYFTMRQQLKTISRTNPNVFVSSLPETLTRYTIGSYVRNCCDENNVKAVTDMIIERFRGLNDKGQIKMNVLTSTINELNELKNKEGLEYYDLMKIDAQIQKLEEYRYKVSYCSAAGYANAYKQEQKKVKELEHKVEEVKKENWTPDFEEEVENRIFDLQDDNVYQDLLRSFNNYRNFLAKAYDEKDYRKLCNDYYKSCFFVSLPTAEQCQKAGYDSKFHYCYTMYYESTVKMIKKMYKDCVEAGYLDD